MSKKKQKSVMVGPTEIAWIRESLDESRTKFALHFGVKGYTLSSTAIKRWESGENKPSPCAMKILHKLRVKVYELYG